MEDVLLLNRFAFGKRYKTPRAIVAALVRDASATPALPSKPGRRCPAKPVPSKKSVLAGRRWPKDATETNDRRLQVVQPHAARIKSLNAR
jgi:hypothetical protein